MSNHAKDAIALSLTDNSFDKHGWWIHRKGHPLRDAGPRQIPLDPYDVADAITVLDQYSGESLERLCKDDNGKNGILTFGVHNRLLPLLTIGHRVHRNVRESGLFTDSFRIDTGNLMGWVTLPDKAGKRKSIRLAITSRFDEGQWKGKGKKEGQCFFLNYMLARACRVNPLSAIDIDRENKGGMELVLFLLFANYLAKAEPYGVMRAYVKLRKNDLNVKGRIDVSRHVKLNYPICDRIAYVQRKLTADIPVNHLIRHAAEAVCKRRRGLIESNPLAKSFLEQLRMATPSWRSDSVSDTARSEATRVVSHPYHAEQYEPLRKLALMILRNEGVNLYGKDDGETVSGIVFDGSWVWENYLWAILRLRESRIENLVHCDNATRKPCIHPFKQKKNLLQWFPDFYIDRNDEMRAVLDAKYKPLDRRFQDGEWINEDVHEVLSFMYALPAKKGFLLYPYRHKETGEVSAGNDNNKADAQSKNLKFELNGFGGHFGIVGLEIPEPIFCDSCEENKKGSCSKTEAEPYARFCCAMQKSEKTFLDQLNYFLKQTNS